MSARVEEALRIATTLGCRLLPCKPGTKVARLKDWPNKASADRRDIEQWFGRSQANPALITGFESGFFIVDVDPKHGGVETVQQWIADHGALPETLTVKTPSGGRHLYFRWPAGGGIGNRGHVDVGIDIRGEGGYALVPGSVMADGGVYEWVNWGKSIADAPDWLLQMIRRHHQAKPAKPGPAPVIPIGWGERDREERVAKAALESICSEITSAPNGQQDNTLNGGAYRIGRWVARGHLPEDYARDRLTHAGMQMPSHDVSDPWTPLVIVKKVRRAMEDGRSAGPADLAPRDPPQVIEGGSKRPRGAKTPEGAAAPDLSVAASATDWMRGLPFRRGDKGGLDPKDPDNVRLMIEHWPEMKRRYTYDAWAETLMINRPWPEDRRSGYPRPVLDGDFLALHARLWRQHLRPGEGLTISALLEVAQRCWSVNPVTDYLEARTWDGEVRDNWLTTYLGVPDSPEARLFGRKFLIGAAARAMQPRCKNDTMLIVEGEQGAGKSKAFRALFGEAYFSDNLGDIRDRDALMGLDGMWGIEWAEMSGQNRIPEADIKAFLSRQEDRMRLPYGRTFVVRPRRCVVVGTTNRRVYLRDPTGARRYWPVVSENPIDVEGLARDRDQLWAEAMHRLEAGETWWLEGPAENDLARAAQEARFEVHPWEGIIAEKMANEAPAGFISTSEILGFWVGLEQSRMTSGHSRELAAIMERLGVRQHVGDVRGPGGKRRQIRGYWFER